MSLISVRDLTIRFKTDEGLVTAVNNVSLDIYKGELFCLLGGSGCGKTTLLRMMAYRIRYLPRRPYVL